jgi:ATP-binding cassette subfamily F protein uup
MLQPADILLLDEPTNDLDIPTLEVLENNLADFPGAIVLITHDRYLLDRLSTLLLALDGTGGVEYFADLSQWEQASAAKKASARPAAAAPAAPKPAPADSKKKLSYNEAREWDQIEARIHSAETRLEISKKQLEVPEVLSDPARLTAAATEIEEAQAEVDRLYDRWAELEAKRA